jgi:hypothetical protein
VAGRKKQIKENVKHFGTKVNGFGTKIAYSCEINIYTEKRKYMGECTKNVKQMGKEI